MRNVLNQRGFCGKMDNMLAKYYYIDGVRAKPKSIKLNRKLMAYNNNNHIKKYQTGQIRIKDNNRNREVAFIKTVRIQKRFLLTMILKDIFRLFIIGKQIQKIFLNANYLLMHLVNRI